MLCERPCPMHHCHEFLEVDCAVTVLVDLLQDLACGLNARGLLNVTIAEHLLQLLRRDPSIVVQVENLEGTPTDILLQVLPSLEGGGQELGVVDNATAIGIHVLHDLLQVRRDFCEAGLRDALLHLVHCQLSVPVVVEGHEGFSQGFDLVLVELTRDDVERSLLQLVLRPEAAEIVDKVVLEAHIRGLGGLVLNPLVVQRLLCGVPVARVHLQQHANQVLGILGDVLPVRVVEGEVAQAHLGEHLRIGLTEEGRVAAEHDVHDHSAAPDVAELIVLPGEDLRGHVVRCPRLCGEHLVRLELA
mmetsp:Transcript_36345/g.79295  ORF Transcript_36345/g.79295 Transcript_36345/m.79295 type:complete len:302 (+) Transcript_36345:115-1020(+)